MKSNLVIAVYTGARRHMSKMYCNDPLSYFNLQLEALQLVRHNLSAITFVFNGMKEPEGVDIPERLGTARVSTIYRENRGMSYGAFSDAYEQFRTEYDYYFFLEDDYIYTLDDFDKEMIGRFESKDTIGVVAPWIKRNNEETGFPDHPGIGAYMTSSVLLEKIREIYGRLPYPNSIRYRAVEVKGQVGQTAIFKEDLGLDMVDLGDRFNVIFRAGIRSDFCCIFDKDTPPLLIPGDLACSYLELSFADLLRSPERCVKLSKDTRMSTRSSGGFRARTP